MSWISQADCLARPAGSVNTALSNLITSTLTAKLSKGKIHSVLQTGEKLFKYSLTQQIPLQPMTSGIWGPLPCLSIPLSPCPWDGARRRCSQAEQAHGTLERAKTGRSELPVHPCSLSCVHPRTDSFGSHFGLVSILTPTKGPVQSPGTWGK